MSSRICKLRLSEILWLKVDLNKGNRGRGGKKDMLAWRVLNKAIAINIKRPWPGNWYKLTHSTCSFQVSAAICSSNL